MTLQKNFPNAEFSSGLHVPDAVTQKSSVRKMFQEILQNSIKRHLCHSLFFNKVAGPRPEACNFIKKEALAQVFSCEFCEISKNTFSCRTPRVAASDFAAFGLNMEIYSVNLRIQPKRKKIVTNQNFEFDQFSHSVTKKLNTKRN